MGLEESLSNLPEDIESNDVKELRNALFRMQKKLLRAKTKTEDLVEATHQAAYDAMLAMGPLKPVAEPKVAKGGKAKPEVALWHMTDWQGAKKTTTYNSEVMRKRVMDLLEHCKAKGYLYQMNLLSARFMHGGRQKLPY